LSQIYLLLEKKTNSFSDVVYSNIRALKAIDEENEKKTRHTISKQLSREKRISICMRIEHISDLHLHRRDLIVSRTKAQDLFCSLYC